MVRTVGGDPRPSTIRDVAERSGVSTATVSRILSGALAARPETRDRVLAAVRDLGYRPSGIARSLKLRTTATIGLIVTDIANPFFPELVRAVEDAARDHDYAVLLGNGDEDAERETAYLELLAQRRVDGLLVASGGLTERHGQWLAAAPVPVVLMNCELVDGSRPAILTDHRAGARLAAEHLLNLGHRRLAHIAGRPEYAATGERLAGMRDAVAAVAGASLAVVEGDGHVPGGERAMRELHSSASPPTAVACYNDLTAIGAIRALHALGLGCPADVSVVGFDDIDVAEYVEPPLTTVAQDTVRLGRLAVERLVEIVRGAPGDTRDAGERLGPRTVRLLPELCVRASTGPATAG